MNRRPRRRRAERTGTSPPHTRSPRAGDHRERHAPGHRGHLDILRRLKKLGVRLPDRRLRHGLLVTEPAGSTLDILKIDRAFVTAIDNRTDDASLAPAVVSLANTMHLKVIAEGVETRTQADALAAMGCDLAQGFLSPAR